MVIFLLPLIYGLTFKISTQIGMRCCSCLIAWPAASSLGIAYVISFPESIYQNAELAFVVFSIAVRILEVVFAFFMVISLPKRKRPVRSSNSSLSLCTDSDEITDNHYLLPELCSSSKHAFAPAKHKLQLNIPKNSNSEERLDRITRARLDQARIQPSDGRINFYAPLSKFNMAPLSTSASIIRTPSNPRRNLSASLFQLGGSYREPESTRSELGYFPEDEFSHDVRRMNR